MQQKAIKIWIIGKDDDGTIWKRFLSLFRFADSIKTENEAKGDVRLKTTTYHLQLKLMDSKPEEVAHGYIFIQQPTNPEEFAVEYEENNKAIAFIGPAPSPRPKFTKVTYIPSQMFLFEDGALQNRLYYFVKKASGEFVASHYFY